MMHQTQNQIQVLEEVLILEEETLQQPRQSQQKQRCLMEISRESAYALIVLQIIFLLGLIAFIIVLGVKLLD